MFTVGQVICRASRREAEDYYRHAIIDNADWGAIDGMLANKHMTPQTLGADEYAQKQAVFREPSDRRLSLRRHARPRRRRLAGISQAGIRGIGLSFVNYLDELPYFCSEVLPRLARLGVRAVN